MSELHDCLHEGDYPPTSVPYRCDHCGAVFWTGRRNPRCLGAATAPHSPSATHRVDERDVTSPERCSAVMIR